MGGGEGGVVQVVDAGESAGRGGAGVVGVGCLCVGEG